MPPIAIVCQGAAILAGATPAEAVRVWEAIGPRDVPADADAFAELVRDALQRVRDIGPPRRRVGFDTFGRDP